MPAIATVHALPVPAARVAVIEQFEMTCEIRGLSERTATLYGIAVRKLDHYLTRRNDPRGFEDLTAPEIDAFLFAFAKGRDGFDPHADSTVNGVYRGLLKFYAWHSVDCLAVDHYPSPMARVTPRHAGEAPYDGKVLTPAQVEKVLATVSGRSDFTSVRDHAIMQLLRLGLRRTEIATLTIDRIVLRGATDSEITVHGKGDKSGPRVRTVAIGAPTVLALMAYLQIRGRHRLAYLEELWIGKRGALTIGAFTYMVRCRGEQAGIAGLHPHKFRHTAAARWLQAGASESEGLDHFGWKTREMFDRYGRATRAERSRTTARRVRLDG